MRRSLKSYFARKHGKGAWTKPERIIFKILRDKLNIGFIWQHRINCVDDEGKTWSFKVDFFIPPNIVIEVDGDKVHGTRRQLNKMKWRDELLEKHGYKVYHFWQSDIEFDPDFICKQIKEVIGR